MCEAASNENSEIFEIMAQNIHLGIDSFDFVPNSRLSGTGVRLFTFCELIEGFHPFRGHRSRAPVAGLQYKRSLRPFQVEELLWL